MLRFLLRGLGAIVTIAIILFFVAPLFFSADDIRDKVLAQVESATGYRIRIDGPVSFSMFPSIELAAEDVGIAQSAAGDAPEFATAKKLEFGLVFSALLNGKVQMTRVSLIDPVIAVPAAKAKPVAAPGEAAEAGEGGTGGSSAMESLQRLSLDKLVIKNGTVILPPSGGKPGKRIEALDLEASLPSINDPLVFDAAAVLDGKAMRGAGRIESFGQFLEGAATPVSLAAEAPAFLEERATLTGTATYKNDAFTLASFSAKAGDKSLTGNAVYKGETLYLTQFTAKAAGNVLTGNANYKGNILQLHPFTAKAYGNTLSGSLAADLSGKVPVVNAALTADTLNLNSFAAKPGASAASGGAAGGGGGAGGAASGWSDAKIDFSPLKLVNGKLKLTAKQLLYDKLKLSAVTIDANLANGKLTAQLPGLKLYNGAGSLALAIDASGKVPAQRVKLDLAKFDAYSFLRDAAQFERIEGTGTIALDLSASGASQRAMVSALNGTAKLDFANGAIRGINIAKTMRNLTTGIVSGWEGSGSEKTDFAALGASFKVANGQAQTSDLKLVGPLVRMSGAGTVNLPPKTLNFRVEPQIVASLEGQGGKTDLQGLGVPVVISGPWANPKIYPDIKGILQNPAAAYEQLNQLGGGLVSLPGLDKSGATGAIPAVGEIIKDGKVNKDALRDSIGQLLNKDSKPKKPAAIAPANAAPAKAPPATAAPANANAKQAPAPTAAPVAPKKKEATAEAGAAPLDPKAKKKKQKAEREEAAKQLLESLLGN